jgi:hypothetical protein
MRFGHAHPVQPRDGEKVLVALALVGVHARRAHCTRHVHITGGGVPVSSNSGFRLLAVAIPVQVGPEGIEVMPNGDESEVCAVESLAAVQVFHGAARAY